ncbi:MAG: DUF4167 domain-containing protein [Rhodobacteraceae bacterium]|nr:DUF4167 domain-containing protein [Paracoccaceae bacterium]
MRSSKSRSRSKNNRNRSSVGNVVNRVFDSSGPEGKVRGTPQQIIDKYNQLARDAQLSNDRVAAENFQQHAEHYLRLLSEAQREQEARREQQERENRERQAQRDRERAERDAAREAAQQSTAAEQPALKDPAETPQPDVVELEAANDESGLVDTPESKTEPPAKPKPARKPRKPRAKKTEEPVAKDEAPAAPQEDAAPQAEPEAAEDLAGKVTE